MSKAKELIGVLNKMIKASEPIKWSDINNTIKEKEKDSLVIIEQEDDRIGIRPIDYDDASKGHCMTTFSIIATITDVLIGERMAFDVDDNEHIVGVSMWKGDE